MRKPNAPVGKCPCPVDTSHEANVFKFANRAKTDEGKRKAGKFYLHCSTHGKLGLDASPWVQEHVLATITWAKDHAPDTTPASAEQRAEGQPGQRPQDHPATSAGPPTPETKSERSSSGGNRPTSAQNTPAKPAPKPLPKPWWVLW